MRSAVKILKDQILQYLKNGIVCIYKEEQWISSPFKAQAGIKAYRAVEHAIKSSKMPSVLLKPFAMTY